MRLLTSVLATLVAVPIAAHAEVLCARSKNGALSGALRVRAACKKREVQVDLAALGLCCDAAATTTTTVSGGTTTVPVFTTTTATGQSTTSLTCPTITTTTLGVNVCGGNPPNCNGLCANARACENDGVACSCTGPTLPCGVVTNAGACGGSCPTGMQCEQSVVLGTDGCPEAVACGCVAQ